MDHWKLDTDDAAFEEERLEKQRLQQQEAARLHEEGAEFYRLARATQETVHKPPTVAPTASSAWGSRGRGDKRKLPAKPTAALKVLKVQPRVETSVPSAASVASMGDSKAAKGVEEGASVATSSGALLGLAAYGSSDDDDDE